MQLVEPVVFPGIEVVRRLVQPAFDLIKMHPDSVMPQGHGPVWCPVESLPARQMCLYPRPDGPEETIEHDGIEFAPWHVLDYMPFQPYATFDAADFDRWPTRSASGSWRS